MNKGIIIYITCWTLFFATIYYWTHIRYVYEKIVGLSKDQQEFYNEFKKAFDEGNWDLTTSPFWGDDYFSFLLILPDRSQIRWEWRRWSSTEPSLFTQDEFWKIPQSSAHFLLLLRSSGKIRFGNTSLKGKYHHWTGDEDPY